MKQCLRRMAGCCAVAAGLVVTAGCVPLVVGAAATAVGGHLWTQGNLELTVEHSVHDLYAAARQAFEDMGIVIERDRQDIFSAYLSGRDTDGRKVLVRISGEAERVSRVRVRVGVMGDHTGSHIVMNRILGRV